MTTRHEETTMSSSLETLVREARTALGRESPVIGQVDHQAPRYELFHAPNSICSQKVRVVLAQRGLSYVSHTMNLFTGETYLPAYVRLRMLGCEQMGASLMTAHSGSTSVSHGGCDPAVVPTLVDWQTAQVVVDSKRICFHLDEMASGGAALRPAALAGEIDAQLDIVDNLPNYQMLSGRPPGTDTRPPSRPPGSGVEFAMSKVERCDRYLKDHASDDVLVRGYAAKRSKELDAAQRLFTPEAMRDAYARAQGGCEALERVLSQRGTRWILSDEVSMADLFWAIELLRMRNMGAARFWTGGKRPAVEAFLQQAEAIASVRSGVIDWPGATY